MNHSMHPMYGQQYPPYPYSYPVQPSIQPNPNKMIPPPGYQKKSGCGCGQRKSPY